MSNIFEQASRQGLRVQTSKGLVSTEQLWSLPLLAANGFSLNTVAQQLSAQIKGVGEENFVAVAAPSPEKQTAELGLEIVKHIIAVKQAENAANVAVAAKAKQKARLIELLATKQDEGLKALSEAELLARIEAL